NKSIKDLIQYLVKAAGYNANFLLNVGPMPNGKIQPDHVALLKQMGEWLNKNGETIYGTQGGPVSARNWGVTTSKGNKVYVHILDWQDESLVLPAWGKKVRSAKMFGSGTPVKSTQNDFGVVLKVPAAQRDEIGTIVELEVR